MFKRKHYGPPTDENINRDYDRWNNIVKHLEHAANPRDVRAGEVYWVALGKNPGTEIDGKGKRYARPMVVVKAINHNAFIGVPLTSRGHYEDGYCALQFGDQVEFATLMQVRITSTKRLYNRMGRIDNTSLNALRRTLRDYLELTTKEDTQTTVFIHDSDSGATASAPRRSFSTENFHAEFGGEPEEEPIDWAEGHIESKPTKKSKVKKALTKITTKLPKKSPKTSSHAPTPHKSV